MVSEAICQGTAQFVRRFQEGLQMHAHKPHQQCSFRIDNVLSAATILFYTHFKSFGLKE